MMPSGPESVTMGSVAGRLGQLIAVLRRAEPSSSPSGWALALDAALAVAAATVAVLDVAHSGTDVGVFINGPFPPAPPAVEPGMATLAAGALTALPLAFRRLYPITAWLVIIAAIV